MACEAARYGAHHDVLCLIAMMPTTQHNTFLLRGVEYVYQHEHAYDQRLLDSSEDIVDDDGWTPLHSTDYVHLGLTVAYQCIVLLTVGHLWYCRKWPPYVPRQISLCAIAGVAGVIAYVGALIAYGVFDRHDGDIHGE